MKDYVYVTEIKPIGKEKVIKAMNIIGQGICDRAEEVCNDLEDVESISITADIKARRTL